jgi:multiple sugar transport system permease protein/putative aldouronate transport system permease protein
MIFAVGSLLSVGYEKVYLMQNDLNMFVSETISTYVYKRGLKDVQYSYSTAVDLFNSVVNLVMISLVNFISNKVNGSGLW